MCCRWEEEAATAAATEVLAMAEVKAAATEAEIRQAAIGRTARQRLRAFFFLPGSEPPRAGRRGGTGRSITIFGKTGRSNTEPAGLVLPLMTRACVISERRRDGAETARLVRSYQYAAGS